MAFLAPLAPLVLPALVSAGAAYGVQAYTQHQAKKNIPGPVAPPKSKAIAAQPSPTGGSYVFEAGSGRSAAATGGDAAIVLDPLGKTGGAGAPGGGGRSTMLGR